MSDAPQGEGWWQASDRRWYPPESMPATPPPATPPPSTPPPGAPPPSYGSAVPGQPPNYGAPAGGQPPGYGPPPGGPTRSSSRTVWIILLAVLGLLVVVCGGCTLFAWVGVREAGIDVAEIAQEAGRDFSNGVTAIGPTSCDVVGYITTGSDVYSVEVTVTNESGIDSHYQISYDLVAPDGRSIGSDVGIVSDVPAGDEVRDTNFGFLSGTIDPSDVTCEVTRALRIPA